MFNGILDGLVSSDSDSYDDIDTHFGGKKNDEKVDDRIDEKVDEEKIEDEIIIGIDLGTTNSCISICRNQKIEIIPDANGNKTIPSVVAFTNKNKYVGKAAKNQIDLNPENTYYEIKRLIGRKYNDISVQDDMPFLTYNVDKDEENNIIVKSELSNRKKKYTPEEITSMILTELKLTAENYLQKKVNKVVITVPAYFNDAQRQATKDASIISGLDCVRIINEPTAAALAYGLEKISFNDRDKELNVIVYDLGGGTLDVSLLNICDGVFEVLASTGNTHLGGADFDKRLVSHCITYFKKKNKISKLSDLSSISLQKLRKSCENAKKILSVTHKSIIAVENFYNNENLYLTLTRDNFDKLCRDIFILCLKPIQDVLTSGGMSREDVDEIILVGGGTRMPTIRNNLQKFFNGKEPNSSINPD
jgi:heat shock protein 1/8